MFCNETHGVASALWRAERARARLISPARKGLATTIIQWLLAPLLLGTASAQSTRKRGITTRRETIAPAAMPASQPTVRVAPGGTGAWLLPVMRNCFSGGNETFGLQYTADDFATMHDFVPGDLALSPGKGLRDPCIFQSGGTWYLCCTEDAWNSGTVTTFPIYSSPDLVTWTRLVDVIVPFAGRFIWAPKFFYDPRTDRLHVSVSTDDNPGLGYHRPRLGWCSLTDPTTWTWTGIPGGLPVTFWDFQIASDGIAYYASGVDSAAPPSIKIFRSTSIDSGYTPFSSFDFGAGEFAEQCWLIWTGGTTWSMYYTVSAAKKTFRRVSVDSMATWSAPALLSDYAVTAKSFTCPFPLQPTPVPGQPGQSGQMSVIFGPTVPGHTYAVKYRTALAGGTWLPLISPTQIDNGTERTITDYNATGRQKFYRVDVTAP